MGGSIEIPDNDSNGTSLILSNADSREIILRLFIDISAEARGDIRIDLITRTARRSLEKVITHLGDISIIGP